MWHVFVNVMIRWGVGVCYRRQQNHIFWITVVLLWQTESAWDKESNTDYLYKLLTFIVVYMVVYSSLPVVGTTANIICVTWHWSVLHTAELLLKHHLCLKVIYLCTGCFTVGTWPKSHGLRLGEYGLITLPDCNTEQHFNNVCWLGCDIVVYCDGIFSQFWLLLPNHMTEMVLQKWFVIMFTHSQLVWSGMTYKNTLDILHQSSPQLRGWLCWNIYFQVTGWYHSQYSLEF